LFNATLPKHLTSVTQVVTNNIGDIFGQVIRMGKGTVWLLPATHQNVDIIQLFALRLEKARQLAPQQAWEKPSAYDIALKNVAEKHYKPLVPIMPVSSEATPIPVTRIELFISHSNADAGIAAALINLLMLAIKNLPHDVIRCTSVPGYQLEGGAKTDEQLLSELSAAKVFVALLSRHSLQSTYVLFELGARWGAGKPLIPLLVAGMTASELRAPLSGLNALSVAIEAQLHDLISQIAAKLGLTLTKASVYESHIKNLIQVSEEEAKKRATEPSATAAVP
jgi:hypothetical protein